MRQLRKYDYNPMERTLGADADAGTKPAELRQEIPPDIDGKTGVMEGDSGCVMTAFHTFCSVEIQGMGYILHASIRRSFLVSN